MIKSKILHMIETRGPGGAEYVLLNLSDSLNEIGYKNYGLFIKEGWISDKFKERNYKTLSAVKESGNHFIFFFLLLKFLRNEKIDLLHSHEFHMGFWGALFSFLFGIKSLCTVHGMNYHCDSSKRRIIMRFIARYSRLVVVSKEIKDYICNRAGVLPERVLVIENGIKLRNSSLPGELKKELGLSSEDILVGSVGRLHPVKGQKYLLEAAKKICSESKNINFFIAGEGSEKDFLDKYIRDNGLQGRFFLLGNREDMDNIFASCDLFVLPSLSEGTPLALLEAMSVGLPIIATNVGSNPSLIKEKKQGILIEPGSSEDIYKALKDSIDMDRPFRVVNESIELIRGCYSVDKMVDRYTEIYCLET